MPALLGPEDREAWLYGSVEEARRVMRPYDPDAMEAVEVGPYVSDARNEGAECVCPLVDSGHLAVPRLISGVRA